MKIIFVTISSYHGTKNLNKTSLLHLNSIQTTVIISVLLIEAY